MTKIYIIRHAEVLYTLDKDGNKLMYPTTCPISNEGITQVKSFAEQLKLQGVAFDKIYTSPYTRATQSATILKDILQIPILIEDGRFQDPWIPGWIGVPLYVQQQLAQKGEDIYMNPRSDDQEKYEDVATRAIEGLYDITDNNEGGSVAIVSHGDTIRLMMYRLEHPAGEIPNMSILGKYDYLKRGEAWFLTFDKEGKFIEKQLLTNEGGTIGEKEYTKDSARVSTSKSKEGE